MMEKIGQEHGRKGRDEHEGKKEMIVVFWREEAKEEGRYEVEEEGKQQEEKEMEM